MSGTRAVALLAFVFLAGSACDSATEPERPEGAYYASSANGHSLPLRRIEWFANSAGACERDLSGADLFMGSGTEFDLFIHYTLRCQGAVPQQSGTHLNGVYTMEGAQLNMTPFSTTSDVIRGAEVSGRSIFIVIRRAETDYRLRFDPQG